MHMHMCIIHGNVDILIITETKLDDTFTNSQFKIEGFSYPYRLDRTKEGEGIMLLIREDIPSKILIKHSLPVDIEAIMVEINLRKTKFLLLATYYPPSPSDQYYFDHINIALDRYAAQYDKVLLGGEQETETCIDHFSYQNHLTNIVIDKTCFKNPNNPTSIDLFLTNFPNSFQNTSVV